MSYEGQIHHPHQRGTPPNAHLIESKLGEWNPTGLQLVQAHWFVRHGERSPVRRRLTGVGDIPSVFQLCAAGRQFSNAVLDVTRASTQRPELVRDDIDNGTASTKVHSFEGAEVDRGSSYQNEEREVIGNVEGASRRRRARLAPSVLNVRRLTEQQGDGNESIKGGMSDCYWGELTDLGRESTLTLGTLLRKLYVDRLQFLPSTLPDVRVQDNPVTFRSTGMMRTIESLHQIAVGLFPEGYRQGPVEYTVRNANDESLYPNSLCPQVGSLLMLRMRAIDIAGAKKAADNYNDSLAEIDPLVRKYIKSSLRIDGKPAASSVLDTIYVARAHGIRVPSEFEDPRILKTLEAAVVHEWFDVYSNNEFRKLAMGRLLGDLNATLQRKAADVAERTEKTKLAIYACHDTSVGGILNALDAFDGRWPPFTSHLAVELFRSKSASTASSSASFLSSFVPSFLRPGSSQQHYVRLLFNAKSVSLPACQAVGKHLPGSNGTVCTLEAFSEAVNKVAMTGQEWEQGCAVVVKPSTSVQA
ncbi:hypothetical protein OIO90_006334 [Microbotryomycetes sp. JL221]|nr:hypothetical protein OIO90_006334 [Microbotryomycetes sp. JL221]